MGRRITAASSTPLEQGTCVLYEQDRGVDMGRVVQCEVENGECTATTTAAGVKPSFGHRRDTAAPVLSVATAAEEYRWLYTDVAEAEKTLVPCREAAARLGMPLSIVAAVYQFHRTKLTFFYESPVRVDFRQLLPTLFSLFHCRIWMERLDPPSSATGEGEAAVEADQQQQQTEAGMKEVTSAA